MGVKPGYKQTEVGVIPEDWEVVPLGEHASFRTGPFGSALHKSDYTNDGVPVVNPMHIVQDKIQPTRTMTISQDTADRLSDFRLKVGEIVIGRRGDMGRCAVIAREQEGWLCGTGSMIIRPSGCYANFLQRILSSPRAIAAIEDASVGTTMVNLNQSILAALKIQFPPLAEQRVIVETLSDMDALLDGLDRLIAKKRDIKQATMQQLLTGRTRLPGFQGGWEVKRLGDVLRVCHGKSQHEVESSNGEYPILASGGQIGRATRPLYDQPSVLIGRKGTINKPQYMDRPFWTVDTLFYCVMNGANSALFFYYLFCTIDWMQFNEASGVPSLNSRTIEQVNFACPLPKEQSAIAALLSDMDAELVALQARRDKTRDLKQGMMQELLTGKTRLIPSGGEHE